MLSFLFVFFNETATTEIYTYGHTLSLHDALPICSYRIHPRPSTRRAGLRRPFPVVLRSGLRPIPTTSRTRPTGGRRSRLPRPRRSRQAALRRSSFRPASPSPCRRSEEHTSELQSLMRISYAVFCLKKKKNTKHK